MYNTKTIIKKLDIIAEHYKKEYALTTFFSIFDYGNSCVFNGTRDTILISISYIKKQQQDKSWTVPKRLNIKRDDLESLYIGALLHEIKHSIDWKSGF